VPEEVKQERRARFMLQQEAISARRLERRVGTRLRVLVDSIHADGALARSSADAPEIDGTVHVNPHGSLKVGEFASVRITRAGTHDLWAEVTD
jgi:ribosomal protein S12 methylthiotransferase